MDAEKYSIYYPMVDCYRFKEFKYYDDEKDPDEAIIFKLECPFEIGVLMNHLYNIILRMYKDLGSREKVENEIEKIKKNPIDSNYKKYYYRFIILSDLFHADYKYLKENYLIKQYLVPDEKSFYKPFSHPDLPDIICPFSINEFYYKILPRAINIIIKNVYDENEKIYFS